MTESFPVASDVHGALSGIFLLHETYEMDLKKFSRGLVEVPGSDGRREVAGEIALTDQDLGRDSESDQTLFHQTRNRVSQQVSDLGWFDFDSCCPTCCLVLVGLVGIWLHTRARLWNIRNQSQPNQGPRPAGRPCTLYGLE